MNPVATAGRRPAKPSGVDTVLPRARCHACGDLDIHAVCSRCRRLVCRKHDSLGGMPPAGRILHLFAAESTGNPQAAPDATTTDEGRSDGSPKHDDATAGGAGKNGKNGKDDGSAANGLVQPRNAQRKAPEKPAGRETGPVSGEPPAVVPAPPADSPQRHFCTDCVPYTRPFDAEMFAAAVTAGVGLVVIPFHTVLGALLLAVGGLRLAVRFVLGVRRRSRNLPPQPDEPMVNPTVRKITITEKISGTARFTDDRQYHADVAKVVGCVKLEGTWSRSHRRVIDLYRRRTRKEPANVRAGCLVLRGPGQTRFRDDPEAGVAAGPQLDLRPLVNRQPVLSAPAGLGNTQWKPAFEYDIAAPEQGWTLPIWVTPGLVPDMDRHVLELEVHWATRGPLPDDVGVPLQSLRLLQVDVPAEWGDIEYLTPLGDRTVSRPWADASDGTGRQRITWKRVSFDDADDRGVQRLYIRFSEKIDLGGVVTGQIEARFTGAVSKLLGASLYRTDGGSARVAGTRKPLTSAVVDFELSLRGLRYQEHRAVPDRSRPDDSGRIESETFQGVVPDHRTVALLTDNLADEGYYIIRVLENPAQPGTAAGVVNRFWDLGGRHYDGVYPVDFHLVLTGEEKHKGLDVTGYTSVRLTVHGSYANDDMEAKVVEEWNRLWKRIRLTVGEATRGPDGGPRKTDQPLDASGKELTRLRNVMLTMTVRISDAAATGDDITEAFAAELVDQIETEFGLGNS